MTDHRVSKTGLQKLKEEFPKGFDPERSYGIIPRQPRPEDRLWVLDYDPENAFIKEEIFESIQKFKAQLADNEDKSGALNKQHSSDLDEFPTFAFGFFDDKAGISSI